MHLSPKEIDKLMLHNAGFLAQKRYARGVLLNYVETVALVSAQMLEFIRDGDSVKELMEKGKRVLGYSDVMPGVAEMVHEIQVEGTFADGTKLVTVHTPVCREAGEEELALYGSGLTRTIRASETSAFTCEKPGNITVAEQAIVLNANRETITIPVLNRGDRPVQVGSHYPFFETNPTLEFDRGKAYDKRLDIAAGTAVRFEPGETKSVDLVAIAGNRKVMGGNALISGVVAESKRDAAVERAVSAGFLHKEVE